MPRSPLTKVIDPPLNRKDLEQYRKDIYEYERRNEVDDGAKYLPEELIWVAQSLLEHAEFLEDKLDAKINVHNRDLRERAKEYDKLKSELMERSNEYDKLKSEYDAYKSKMAVEHPYLANAEPENDNNNSKDQKSYKFANPRKRDRENVDLADKTDEKRVCVVAPSGTESVATEQEADVDELERS
ncbi:hypothetical protein MMC07_009257 [Pseudocyphellaria aurata]|nr:hypothetical protein [Pseudocyphellaria aurata]